MGTVLHIIPYDGIGGVETAARSVLSGDHGDMQFQRCYITRQTNDVTPAPDWHGAARSENDPRAHWAALRHILSQNPDLVIASLWRSCFIFLMLRLLRPRMKSVLFLHLPHDVHVVDKILNRLAMYLADEIWADSQATLQARVPHHLQTRGRVISFLINRLSPPAAKAPTPNFVFWGRLHSQKGLARALGLFAEIHQQMPQARLNIIGPDGGCLGDLQNQTRLLGLEQAVTFSGPMTQAEITPHAAKASFYLQTSLDEGMALSVIEAMQMGLVPVVTAVGEIATYCQEGHNALILKEETQMVRRIQQVLNSPETYAELSRNAVATWQGKPLYRDDVITACRTLLDRNT